MKEIIATISVCRQVGPEDFTMYRHSKVFNESSTLIEINQWAKSYGDNYTLLDCTFSSKDN